MRRMLAASAIVLLLPIAGHASQLAFSMEQDPRIPRDVGVLDLRFREVALLAIDGRIVGNTLFLRKDGVLLPPGRYRVDVQAFNESSCALSGEAVVEAGRRTSALLLDDGTIVSDGSLYLRGCKTDVRVLAPPFGSANVTVDGHVVGRAGETISVSSGVHRFEVEAFEAGPNSRRWSFEATLEIQTSLDPIEFWVPLRAN